MKKKTRHVPEIPGEKQPIPQNGKRCPGTIESKTNFSRDNRARFFLFTLVLILLASLGPSEERKPFPLDGSSSYEENKSSPSPPPLMPRKEMLKYTKKEIEINGEPQVIHLLELDLSNPDLQVIPVLSHERLFGFELLSEMNKRYQASATINAGFNYGYGQPAGLVIQNGRILSGSMGYGRTLFIDNQMAWFQNESLKVWLEADKVQIPVDRVNPFPQEEGILVFTPEFGPSTRIEGKYSACTVENDQVVSVAVMDDATDIPKNGFLIVDLRVQNTPILALAPGDSVKIQWDGNVTQGYQCSGSLVENGENVARDSDAWGGNMRIHTPRTAVGIKDSHTLVFLVADGRQPGYSRGVTGKELADVLISFGVTEAALLDGGASSEMIVDNEIVNKPSTGRERLLASAFICIQKDDGN